MSFLLSNEREENYSAVLEWLIHRLPPDQVGQIFGLGDSGTDQSALWKTVREYQVRYGDEIGRLDLVLRRNRRCYLVIEVKTRPYMLRSSFGTLFECLVGSPEFCRSYKISDPADGGSGHR